MSKHALPRLQSRSRNTALQRTTRSRPMISLGSSSEKHKSRTAPARGRLVSACRSSAASARRRANPLDRRLLRLAATSARAAHRRLAAQSAGWAIRWMRRIRCSRHPRRACGAGSRSGRHTVQTMRALTALDQFTGAAVRTRKCADTQTGGYRPPLRGYRPAAPTCLALRPSHQQLSSRVSKLSPSTTLPVRARRSFTLFAAACDRSPVAHCPGCRLFALDRRRRRHVVSTLSFLSTTPLCG